MMHRTEPPFYLLGAIAVAVLLHLVIPLRQFLAFPWRLIGLVPLALGLVVNLLVDNALNKYETTVKPHQEPRALLTGGVFRISRNPMYMGMVAILLGIAILLGSTTPLAVVPVFAFLMRSLFISHEERTLERIFGDEFRKYKARVRRWI